MHLMLHRARALVVGGLIGVVACSGDQKLGVAPDPHGPDAQAKYVVSVTPKRDSLPVGLSRKLAAQVVDAAGAAQSVPVDWASLEPQIATVASGVVTSLSPGTAEIVARYGTAADTAVIVVTTETVHLQVSPNAISASMGDTVNFVAQLVTSGGATFSTQPASWTASDSAAVVLMDGGRAALANVGDAQVTARVGEMTATASVNVFASSVGSIAIAPSTASLAAGSSVDLDAKVYDKNGRRLLFRSVSWASSNSSIATVSGSGTVQGLRRGGVVITATSGGVSSTATVNISSQPASSVTLDINPNPIVIAAKVQAVAVPRDASGNPIVGRPIAYQSSSPSVATIDAQGVITGLIAGATNISAICDGHIATVSLKVEEQHVTSVSIVPATPSVKQGSNAALVADVKDQMGNSVPGAAVTWSSTNPSIASVSSSGVLSGVAIGTSSVKATSGVVSATAPVNVTAQSVASVQVTPSSVSFQAGTTTQLTATAFDANGQAIPGTSFTWVTGDPNVTTVSALGVATAKNLGTTTITATASGKSSSAAITVVSAPPAPAANVVVTLNNGTLNIGQSSQAVATVTDAQGNVLTGRPITWSSATSNVATVSSTGLVTAVAAGTAAIVATVEGVSGNASVTVNPPPVAPVASVTVSAPSTTLTIGQSTQLAVVLKDAQGNVLTGRSIAYASSNTATASVSATGLVKAIAAGSVSISVTSEGVTGALALTVQSSSPPPPTAYSVAVTVNASALQVGQSTQATATVKDASGNVIPGATVTWATSNSLVATVSSSGLVAAVGTGIVAITASTSGITGSAAINVTAPSPQISVVVVSMSSTTLSSGQSLQATAVAKDAAGNPVSGAVFTWSVSSTSVISVTASGLVSGIANGTAQVRATTAGVTGSLSVTVSSPAPPPGPNGLTVPPALPQVYLNYPYPAVTGATITVPAGGNLQTALNNAQRGDEIVLQAGATYTGNFTLPAKSGTAANGWITIRSDQLNQLPLGTRVTPAVAGLMPRIQTVNSAPAIKTAASASGYRLAGVEVTVAAAYTGPQYGIIWLGDGTSAQSTLASVPTDLVLDRLYVHGQPTTDVSRCVGLNSGRSQVSDSYLMDCHAIGADAQAIAGWNGPGPYKIVNNTLAGSTENIMFGGADPWIPNLIPSDIEIRQNYVYTPAAWHGAAWVKKNLFELKMGQRILVEGNVFDGSWQNGQTGWAFVLKSENQSGRCTWCTTSDVTIRYNRITNAGAGIAISGKEGSNPNPVTTLSARFAVQNNEMDNINVGIYVGDNRLLQVLGNASDVEIVHNTFTTTGALNQFMAFDEFTTATRLVQNDNIFTLGRYGMLATNRGEGTSALAAVIGGWQFNNNYLIGTSRASIYPPSTNFISSQGGAPSGAGADQATINAKIAGVIIP
ncbi:MAG: Ig-like domain-containing protein [Gemmatimonadaceae bacterium]